MLVVQITSMIAWNGTNLDGFPLLKVEYLRDYFNPDFDTHRYVYFVQLEEKPNLQLSEGEKAEWFIIDDAFKIELSKRTREDLLYFKKHVLTSK